jgi:glyoxylase-like metal-dependent hydrolase (beta-lactamase superfamily II)
MTSSCRPAAALSWSSLHPTCNSAGWKRKQPYRRDADHLVVLDAPYGELQSRWVIEAAKAKYPGKPIKYLVLTHHHMDHAGGTRTFIAEGANVIVPVPDKAYFEKAARVPHTIVPDALSKKPRAAGIQEVKDAMSLKDDADEIRLYNIPNPHSDGMILAHVVKSNVVYVTDLLTPRASIERNPGTLAVGVALKQAGITGSIIAGGHGTTVKQADLGLPRKGPEPADFRQASNAALCLCVGRISALSEECGRCRTNSLFFAVLSGAVCCASARPNADMGGDHGGGRPRAGSPACRSPELGLPAARARSGRNRQCPLRYDRDRLFTRRQRRACLDAR